MSADLLRCDTGHGHFQSSLNCLGDVSHMHFLFRDCVISRVSVCLFERQPVEIRRIEAVDGRPGVGARRQAGGKAPFPAVPGSMTPKAVFIAGHSAFERRDIASILELKAQSELDLARRAGADRTRGNRADDLPEGGNREISQR